MQAITPIVRANRLTLRPDKASAAGPILNYNTKYLWLLLPLLLSIRVMPGSKAKKKANKEKGSSKTTNDENQSANFQTIPLGLLSLAVGSPAYGADGSALPAPTPDYIGRPSLLLF